ncbi:hypothetical protein AADEFJLK_01915 [Methylovulum psychrotolerans]|uniref:Uncharacterized protein n=1 Tax=Methylovulum psychrotolerans TaxID=1704499 RepID=A0A2S5CNP4_9GAMM|nr:hypothetical protein AADEFJLK_01915 [Methylovulum psychrotolerans]
MGGLAWAELDNGTTTTVRLALFKGLTVTMTLGRCFLISLPRVGSKSTHQILPRCKTVSNSAFPISFQFCYSRVVVNGDG